MIPTGWSRRRFLGGSAALAATALAGPSFARQDRLDGHPARHWTALEEGRVACGLCPWECVVEEGARGRCQVRENRDGQYVSLVYGRMAAMHRDPIEKKPFYHFLPGSQAFSLATAGCNLDCSFCQNWTIARRRPEELPSVMLRPEEVAEQARQLGAPVIAYTYNEPTVQHEFIVDATEKAKAAGLHTVIVSNGFINPGPLKDLCRLVSAYKVDLKSIREDYYRQVVHGKLRPVLDTLVTLKSEGVWTEVVVLVVPTLNDSPQEAQELAAWVVKELGPDVPLHFSRFTPQYRLAHLPPTPVKTLERFRQTALDAGLRYVYLGNVPGHQGADTHCPSCGKRLVGRLGYRITEMHLEEGKCAFCGAAVAGFWTAPSSRP